MVLKLWCGVGYSSLPRSTHSAPLEESGPDECNGACLLSGPAVDIALACADTAHDDKPHGQWHCLLQCGDRPFISIHDYIQNVKRMGILLILYRDSIIADS